MPDARSAANALTCPETEANMSVSKKVTILYERLSREDSRQDESLSIENQKMILETYAVQNGFTPFLHISDDGASGANFQRPGWQELVQKVENDEVSAVIIKTMDRMGRDYLRAGLYRDANSKHKLKKYEIIHRKFIKPQLSKSTTGSANAACLIISTAS